MQQQKVISISILTASLLTLAGCSSTPVATNTNLNANVNVNNVSNENSNTNVAVDEEVDTSDWQTYTNEEYKFSFQYPQDWGGVEVNNGNEPAFLFSNRENFSEPIVLPIVTIQKTGNLNEQVATDGLEEFEYAAIDFTKSDAELSVLLKRSGVLADTVTKIKISNKEAIQVEELREGLTGEVINTTFIIVPNYLNLNNHFQVTFNGGLNDESSAFLKNIEL